MDENRNPGVPTKVWATLGLLAFNGIAAAGLIARNFLAGPWTEDRLLAATLAVPVVTFPDVIVGIALWWNRKAPFLGEGLLLLACLRTCFVFAAGIEVALTGGPVVGALGACATWPVSVVLGYLLMLDSFLRTTEPGHRTPPDEPSSVH